MRCPRCAESELLQGPTQGFDACSTCGGVSIEGATLLTACPSVAGLDRRSLEIELLGRRGQGIAACPRCTQVPYEFEVLNVPIDWCATCGAVWIDGDEREALSVREVSRPAIPGKAGAYRTDARATAQRSARCAICGEILVTKYSYASERGLVCNICQSRDVIEKSEPHAHRGSGWIADLYAWLRRVALAQAERMRDGT